MDEILVTIPEGARRYGCSRSTIYQLIWRGVLPVVKLGPGQSGAVRLRISDLEDLAANGAAFRTHDRPDDPKPREGSTRGSAVAATGHKRAGSA
jgi:excisionase family DNA binding protein